MDGSEYVAGVTGAILAGGRAQRLGGVNKAVLEVDGRRILDRQLAALRAATRTQVIVANDPRAFDGTGVAVIPDAIGAAGPLGGLYTALQASATPRVLVLACDLPYVHASFLRFLVERAPGADAVVPRTADGWHPLCAVYATRVRAIVGRRLERGARSVVGLLDEVRTVAVEGTELVAFDPDGRLFTNINTPGDYEAARRRHIRGPDDSPRGSA